MPRDPWRSKQVGHGAGVQNLKEQLNTTAKICLKHDFCPPLIHQLVDEKLNQFHYVIELHEYYQKGYRLLSWFGLVHKIESSKVRFTKLKSSVSIYQT
jgi:hypothetical protein